MKRYPVNRLHEEVAYIAVTLGWSHDEIVAMTHSERRRWVKQARRINRVRRR